MSFSLRFSYFVSVHIYLLQIKTHCCKINYTADITLHTLRNVVNVCKLHLHFPFTTSISYSRVQVPRKIGTRSKKQKLFLLVLTCF
jgi:hypothetical protein